MANRVNAKREKIKALCEKLNLDYEITLLKMGDLKQYRFKDGKLYKSNHFDWLRQCWKFKPDTCTEFDLRTLQGLNVEGLLYYARNNF